MLIRGGRLVDPLAGIDARRDVRLNAVVTEIGEHLAPIAGEEVIDATGAFVAPGFIDMHVHLREPGNPEKETIESGTEAAVRGGFAAIACMPNTSPALDSVETVAALMRETKGRGRCRVYPVAAITRGRKGAQPCDFNALANAGAVAFSDDGDYVTDANVLASAATAARGRGVFISHCEDPLVATLDRRFAEISAVERDVAIAAVCAKDWHLAHLSTRESVMIVRAARAEGMRVSAEVTPHHLLATAESAAAMGTKAAVNPPLRDEDDARALRDAVRDGTIEVLASDHAPHTAADKERGAPGFSGLEVAVGAYAAALPDVSVSHFVQLLSTAPARVLGIEGGTLQRGAPADVTIFRDESWSVDARAFASRGHVTPFDGATLPRRAVVTVVGGKVAYRA
jgi:dihydroorotase